MNKFILIFLGTLIFQQTELAARVSRLLDERHKKTLNESKDANLLLLHEINLMLREVLFAQRLNDSIKECPWLKSKSFSLRADTANYSFMYILFKIIEITQPEKILEFGAGQTTRLTSQYVAHHNNKAELTLVEHDQAWIDQMKKTLPLDQRVIIHQLDAKNVLYKKHVTQSYKDLSAALGSNTYNLIIIDGPRGSERYSRICGLEAAKNHRAEKFVIIIDDVERQGEADTAQEIKSYLETNKIAFATFGVEGEKRQRVFCSPEYAFLQSL